MDLVYLITGAQPTHTHTHTQHTPSSDLSIAIICVLHLSFSIIYIIMPPPAHDAASYILCTPSQAGTPTTTSKTHTHTTMKHLPVQQQQTAKHCIPHDFLFLINVIPEIREGDQCCALKFMGKNGNKIFFSLPLSLAPSFPLPLAPLTLPSFSFPHLSAHTRAHTHSFFFITRVHSPSRSISNPPTGSSFSASPLLSFILYSLPPPSLPPSPHLSVSFSHTHI